jgi:hypothetical protein
MLFGRGRTHKCNSMFQRRADALIVPPSFRKACVVVRAASDFVRVMIVLTVILPEANRADVEAASPRQGDETTARTRVWATLRATDDVVLLAAHGCQSNTSANHSDYHSVRCPEDAFCVVDAEQSGDDVVEVELVP